jgi:hypothetical protein
MNYADENDSYYKKFHNMKLSTFVLQKMRLFWRQCKNESSGKIMACRVRPLYSGKPICVKCIFNSARQVQK